MNVNHANDSGVISNMTMNPTSGALAVKRHLKHLALEGKSPITIRHRRDAIARLEKILPVPLLEATSDHLYEWRAGMNHKNGTIALYVSHVKCFYDWAITERLIETNPAVATPVPKLPQRFPRPIPEPDLMHALNSATPAMFVRQAIVLAGWCGLRCQEIAGLRVENIRLHDDPPVLIVSAESAKGNRERVIPLSGFVVGELQAARLPLSGVAFPDANGRQREPWSVSRIGNEHLRGCGTKSTMHSLRHRFATQLAHATKDPQVVRELMGHVTLATTAIYMAFSKTGAIDAVDLLPVPGELPPMLEAS